jgi:hypothetical protein
LVEAKKEEVDDVTLPLMMALERLSPLERAAFLLHDVFGVGFEEVAETIGREPATCRQLASRARSHVRAERPRFPMPKERGLEIAAAFYSASRSGDMNQLRSLLAADVSFYSDGGGKRPAAKRPLLGLDDVIQFHAGIRASLRGQDVTDRALRLYQRPAGFRHRRARRRADDGARDRGRPDCRHLCHAQSRQAQASRRPGHSLNGRLRLGRRAISRRRRLDARESGHPARLCRGSGFPRAGMT